MSRFHTAGMVMIAGVFILSACSSSSVQTGIVSGAASTHIIKSHNDLTSYMRTTSGVSSPLDQLSTPARDRFLSSLTFNAKGVTGFRYDDLQTELTRGQIVAVLRLFGLERDAAMIKPDHAAGAGLRPMSHTAGPHIDWFNYKCVSRATCQSQVNDICTSNC